MSQDNVQDLLDSLDIKQSQKAKPKKSATKRKENSKKPKGDDISGFLDELDGSKSKSAQDGESGEAQKAGEPSKSDESKTETSEKSKETDKQETDGSNAETGREPPEIDPVASSTSWWSRNKGGLWSTATKASSSLQDAVSETVKQARQAEANSRDEQPHFSSNSLQNRLTSVLNTIIPPIARHEQSHIHIFHDMVGYPSIDKSSYEVFDYVMDQVEGGGDLNLVVQKGKERHRIGSDHDVNRSLNLAKCSSNDAAKLARANVDSIHTENTPQAEAARQANPNISISEVYVAIQPVVTPKPDPATTEGQEQSLVSPNGKSYFVVYSRDKEHNIEITMPSQGSPEEWAEWSDNDGQFDDASFDPREWVFGWVEDASNLTFGVVAQKYVTTRMGLGLEKGTTDSKGDDTEKKLETSEDQKAEEK